ncbi:hypothetical protein OSB04_010796 [Centaurea solstitialis]|uniref:Uncharacterized protein n=1 Tax=Centaurea solstitialis TaxID=347529 RepID=A0AA38TRC2_9ASTR|nr:hypothetical protein OSB04_010796 [Centaurea solstitialis]
MEMENENENWKTIKRNFSTTKHTLSVSQKRSRDVEETVVVKKERITLTDEPSSWMAVWDDDWCFSNIQPLSPLSPLTLFLSKITSYKLRCEDDEILATEIARLEEEKKAMEKDLVEMVATERLERQITILLCLLAGDLKVLSRMMMETEQKLSEKKRQRTSPAVAGVVEFDGEFSGQKWFDAYKPNKIYKRTEFKFISKPKNKSTKDSR